MSGLTTHRARIISDNDLPLDTKEAILSLLDKEIGYSAPDSLLDEMRDQEDDESPISSNVELNRSAKYLETWHRGAGYSSSKLEWKGICLHHTSGTILGSIDHMTKRVRYASYHCMIGEDGNRYRFVDDLKRAYHAGKGSIKGRNPNHVMHGISYNGDTNSGRFRQGKDATTHELRSTIEFLRPRWDRYSDFWNYSTTHAVVDPKRRADVSESFADQIFSAIEKEFGR